MWVVWAMSKPLWHSHVPVYQKRPIGHVRVEHFKIGLVMFRRGQVDIGFEFDALTY